MVIKKEKEEGKHSRAHEEEEEDETEEAEGGGFQVDEGWRLQLRGMGAWDFLKKTMGEFAERKNVLPLLLYDSSKNGSPPLLRASKWRSFLVLVH